MHRLLKIFLILYLAGNIFGGIALSWLTLHPMSSPITPPQTERQRAACQRHSVQLQDVSLAASGGATLRGWLLQPANPNGDVVLLLHGVKGNRADMMPGAPGSRASFAR